MTIAYSPFPMEETMSSSTDELRIKYGFWTVLVGLGVVLVVCVMAALTWHSAGEVATVVGSITGVVGTIVGAFFGVHVGSVGKEKAEQDRKDAEDKALRLASALPPEIATKILGFST
jgi:hypothetical protein